MNPWPPQYGSLDEAVAILAEQSRVLFEPGQVIELRALDVQRGRERPHVESGFFDGEHLAELVREALLVTPHAKGVYVTLNPLQPDLLARRAYRIDYAQDGTLAKDKDVLARRWLLIDIDPVRDPLISASVAEKERALVTVQAVEQFLTCRGWPEPLRADSGNGYHLLYRVDLPADDGGRVKFILEALAARFDTEHVHVDRSVFNPARICKLPGTAARKGDHISLRPHRRAKFLEGFAP